MVNDIPLNFSYSTQKAAKHFFPIKNSSTPTHTQLKSNTLQQGKNIQMKGFNPFSLPRK